MNLKKFRVFAAFTALACAAPMAQADEWCQLQPGWTIVTQGTVNDNVMILGRLAGASYDLWLLIATSTVGKANIALALTAQASDKKLSIYVISPNTCATFPSWAAPGTIYHIRMHD